MKMTEVSTTGPSKSSWTCTSGFKASYRVVPVELLEPHLNPIDGTLKDFHFPIKGEILRFFLWLSLSSDVVHYQTLRRDGLQGPAPTKSIMGVEKNGQVFPRPQTSVRERRCGSELKVR